MPKQIKKADFQLFLKESPTLVLPCEFCEILQNIFLQVAA